MKIGIFSTFIEPAALELTTTLQHAAKTGKIPNTAISFIFSNRVQGENSTTDSILKTLDRQDIPLISFSASRFKSDMRREARREERSGNASLMRKWRNQFAGKVNKKIPKTDLDILIGDMYIWGEDLYTKRNAINLHPALPDGPKGEWYNVIWELIQNKARKSGVMIHKVTKDLDRGHTIAFCKFPITGYEFNHLWNTLPKDKQLLKVLIDNEKKYKERTNHPLHKKIRQAGFLRETPLIIQTLKALSSKKISFDVGGYDLTRVVEEYIFDKSNHQKIFS